LTEIDGIEELKDVFLFAATNRIDQVDPALLRPGRFDRIFEIPPPDATTRADVLKIHCARLPLGSSVDVAAMAEATEGFVGAELAAVCQEAGRAALRRAMRSSANEPITVESADLVQAIDNIRRGRGIRSLQRATLAKRRLWSS
jgi:transitional endoplasmic reticulum ATPase